VIGDTVEHVFDWPLLDDEHSFLSPGRDTAPYFAGKNQNEKPIKDRRQIQHFCKRRMMNESNHLKILGKQHPAKA